MFDLYTARPSAIPLLAKETLPQLAFTHPLSLFCLLVTQYPPGIPCASHLLLTIMTFTATIIASRRAVPQMSVTITPHLALPQPLLLPTTETQPPCASTVPEFQHLLTLSIDVESFMVTTPAPIAAALSPG